MVGMTLASDFDEGQIINFDAGLRAPHLRQG
jgi:hypothetical protein